LADEPVSAWRDPWATTARRWLKRHRLWAASVVVGVLVGLVSLAIAAGLLTASNEKLSAANVRTRAAVTELGTTYRRLGEITNETTPRQQAIDIYRQALLTWEGLSRQYPDDAGCLANLAHVHNNLGNLYRDTGRAEEAEQAYRRALDLHTRLADAHPL